MQVHVALDKIINTRLKGPGPDVLEHPLEEPRIDPVFPRRCADKGGQGIGRISQRLFRHLPVLGFEVTHDPEQQEQETHADDQNDAEHYARKYLHAAVRFRE